VSVTVIIIYLLHCSFMVRIGSFQTNENEVLGRILAFLQTCI